MKLPPETTVTITRSGSDGFVTTTVAALTGTVPRMSARFIPSEPPGGHPAPEEERWRGSLIVEFGWGAIAGYGFGEVNETAAELGACAASLDDGWPGARAEARLLPVTPGQVRYLVRPAGAKADTASADQVRKFLASGRPA